MLSPPDRHAFCICQSSGWERSYTNENHCDPYKPARDFNADIIIMRIIENCKASEFQPEVFTKAYKDFISYLNKSGNAKVVLTTSFWPHPGDENIKQVGEELGLPVINLGDLGKDDSMMAKGLFEHSGVAVHPGDLGMKVIAERIWDVIRDW